MRSRSFVVEVRTHLEDTMSATYTFDIFCTLDGFGSFDGGDWGGYWGKAGPQFLARRMEVYAEEQRLVLGATTYRQFLQVLGPSREESTVTDPVNLRMLTMPTTVISNTLEDPLTWQHASLERGDAVGVITRLKQESDLPLRSHGSLSLNRTLMAAGLVDRIQVTVFPVISGQTGTGPIFEHAADFDLDLLDARTLDTHTQELTYRPNLHP
jgi:dihydrofolate reductase